MSSENNQILTLDAKDAFKHKIEDYDDLLNSPLKGVFQEALSLAKKVVDNTNAWEKVPADEEKYFSGTDLNNILAFVGDRGSGKTSALLSFSKLLESPDKGKLDSIHGNESKWPKFLALDAIDPSALEGDQRIIEIIVAKLYRTFIESVKPDSKNNTLVNETMDAFNDIMRALRIIRHPDSILKETFSGKEMMLERLEELGTISNLRNRIVSLVKSVLEIAKPIHPTESFLVIAIDDADLHSENPIQVLEDLRKYFRIPRLLILMGVRFDQLHSKIAHTFEKQFRGTQNDIFDDPRNLADAYLRKLIPEDARILMPFTNLRSKSSNWKVKIRGYIGESEMDFPNIFQAIRHLIRKKVGITFSFSPYPNGHPFEPNSLREAHDLFSELSRWNDVPTSKKELRTFENFIRFKHFLLQSWAVGKVPKEMQDHLEEISNVNQRLVAKTIILKAPIVIEESLSKLKGKTVSKTSHFFDPNDEPKLRLLDPNWFPNANYEEIKPMLSPETNPYNIGIGEVAVLLKILDGYYQQQMVTTFIFLVRSICSIRILELVFQNPNKEAWRNLVGPHLLPSEILRQGYDPFRRFYLSSFEFKGLASKLDETEFNPMETEWMEAYLVLESFLAFTPINAKQESKSYRNGNELLLWPSDADEKQRNPQNTTKLPDRPSANRTIENGIFNLTTLFAKAGMSHGGLPFLHTRPFVGLNTTLDPFTNSDFAKDLSKWHDVHSPLWPLWNVESLIDDVNTRLNFPSQFVISNRIMFGQEQSLFQFICGYLSMLSAMYPKKNGESYETIIDALSYYKEDIDSHPIFQLFTITPTDKYKGIRERLKSLFSWLLEVGTSAAQIQVRKEIGLEFADELGRLINSRSQDPRYRNLFRNAIRSLENSSLMDRFETATLIEQLRQILTEFETWSEGGKARLHVNDRRNFGRRFLEVLNTIESLISPK